LLRGGLALKQEERRLLDDGGAVIRAVMVDRTAIFGLWSAVIRSRSVSESLIARRVESFGSATRRVLGRELGRDGALRHARRDLNQVPASSAFHSQGFACDFLVADLILGFAVVADELHLP